MTHQELKEAIKNAMKDRDTLKLSVYRGLLTSVVNELVAKSRKPDEVLEEDAMMALVRRGAKQRKDSMEQFEKGGRSDLAEKEKAELAILEALLPAQMPREEIEKVAKAKAAELGVADKTGANKLMGTLMKDLKGKADGTMVKEVVDELFV